MDRRSFPDRLEQAASDVSLLPPSEISAMLRRAALRLRNHPPAGIDAELEERLDGMAVETGLDRDQVIATILREWLAGDWCPATDRDPDPRHPQDR